MLLPIPGSDVCLETIAQLGNPREVILKVLEVLEKTAVEGEEAGWLEESTTEEEYTERFVTLLGMLGVLHRSVTRFGIIVVS